MHSGRLAEGQDPVRQIEDEEQSKRTWLLETIRAFFDQIDPEYMKLRPSPEIFAKDFCNEFSFLAFITPAEAGDFAEALMGDPVLLISLYRAAEENGELTPLQVSRILEHLGSDIAQRWVKKYYQISDAHAGPVKLSSEEMEERQRDALKGSNWYDIWPEGFKDGN